MGDSIKAICTVELVSSVPQGCEFEFDYGFVTKTEPAGGNIKVYNTTAISPITISSAGKYTCTVTVLASDECQVDGAGKPRTSGSSTLGVRCA